MHMHRLLPALMLPAVMAAAVWTGPTQLTVTPSGNEARYRVREQLAGFDLPNDAVGVSTRVTGGIVLDEAGRLVPGESRIVVDLATLTSDRDRRDGYVRRRILETDQYPTATLVPTGIRGLPWPLPSSGTRDLELTGDLTVHGTTHPTTWRLQATFHGDTVTGTGATRFTFADFGLRQPRVSVVLSVADSITLEYDFRLARTAP